MSRIVWRWEEKDFGFRFRSGKGNHVAEHYQARNAGDFYVVPSSQRKLDEHRVKDLAEQSPELPAPRLVANPWLNYEQDWDCITTEDGLCLNWAGCLDKEEIDRREDEGVQRAMEFVADLVQRPEPATLTTHVVRQIHRELMGNIYPFAGQWRTVSLHKGDGPTRWPFPPSGIQPLMDILEREVLARSPVISEDDTAVFSYTSEVMNEVLAIHPFREGNGRTAFLIANLILMQNSMLPLTTYERRTDEALYLSACEAGRVHKNYRPLTDLLAHWEDLAIEGWNAAHE